jgi:uncharacterized membrane protein
MEVTESRDYAFNGQFHFVYRVLPSSGPVDFYGFKVFEDDKPYRLSDDKSPGTYSIIKKQGQIEVRWFFLAADELKRFDFKFRVKNAVQKHSDTAVLYYQFISMDWDHASRNIRLQIRPPEPLSKNRINEWLHGPLWAESQIEEGGTITVWSEYLPAYTFLEVRALYPPEIFPQAEEQAGYVRSRIMSQEAEWAEEANRLRTEARQKTIARGKRQEQGKWIVIFLSFWGMVGSWYFWKKFGKRPNLPPPVRFSSEIPQNMPPALVGYLLGNREISGGALVSTFLDLARRGFLTLREEQVEKKKLFGGKKVESQYLWDNNRDYWKKNDAELQKFERDLLEFVFNDLTKGENSISLEEIKKNQGKFRRFFHVWKKDVKAIGKHKAWFDSKSIRGMYYCLGIGIVLVILTAAAAYFYGIWAVLLGVVSIFVFVLSFFIPHRTKEGEKLARQWKALKRYLSKYFYRSEKQEVLLPRVDDYFVYGVVFGLSKKIFKELAGLIPADAYHAYFPWYVYHGTGSGTFTPEAFASAFSAMIAVTTSTMSTASGAGGGASVGGGGGASSGGGGAG